MLQAEEATDIEAGASWCVSGKAGAGAGGARRAQEEERVTEVRSKRAAVRGSIGRCKDFGLDLESHML